MNQLTVSKSQSLLTAQTWPKWVRTLIGEYGQSWAINDQTFVNLSDVFKSYDHDIMQRAVLAHLKSPAGDTFPKIKQLWEQVIKVLFPGAIGIMILSMNRCGYTFIEDTGDTLVFRDKDGNPAEVAH